MFGRLRAALEASFVSARAPSRPPAPTHAHIVRLLISNVSLTCSLSIGRPSTFFPTTEPSSRPVQCATGSDVSASTRSTSRPLTREEHDGVRACLQAIDKVMAKPQSVMMRLELAAALLAHACSAAFDSAEAMGQPEEGQERYDTFERLTVLRARELYSQERA